MKYKNLKGSLILLTAALIWGLAFVAQSSAADKAPSFTINALRSFIGAFALYVFYLITNIKQKKTFFPKEKKDKKTYLLAALICGSCLAVSVNLQQFGITALKSANAEAIDARSGFLTALYVILVPILSVFARKKVHLVIWSSVLVAIIGVYLLCFSEGVEKLYLGDALLFLCAISFSVHIMAVDKYVEFTGGVKLSIMQFLICGALSLILALIFDLKTIDFKAVLTVMPQILYLGIMSSGIAYTLQIVGQKFAEPAVASISMSFESVFAALGGWVILGDGLNLPKLIGCALVFAAIIIAQLPQFFIKGKVQT